jgi:death-on-curing protein
VRYLSLEEVILIHERIVERFGGGRGLRDRKSLDSAIGRPQATFEGQDLYPDLFTKAAALGESLARNHPFVDGNKRTAWEAMRTFLEENGRPLRAGPDEIVEFVLCIAEGRVSTEEITTWLRERGSDPDLSELGGGAVGR